MEVEFLRLVATEDDLNRLLSRLLTPPPKLRNLFIEVIPDGLLLAGTYETIISVPFRCLWKLSVVDRQIVVELSDMKCVGVPLNVLRPYVLSALVSSCNMLELPGGSVFLDLDRLLAQMIIPIRANLTSVCCEAGQLVIECGNSH